MICASDRALARCWPALAEEVCRPQHAVKLVVLSPGDAAADGEGAAWVSCDCCRIRHCSCHAIVATSAHCSSSLWPTTVRRRSGAVNLRLPRERRPRAGRRGSPALAIRSRRSDRFGRRRGADRLGRNRRRCPCARDFFEPVRHPVDDHQRPIPSADRPRDDRRGGARAQACLVLDDPRLHAGFAADVLELLAQSGVTTPTSVQQLVRRHGAIDVLDALDELALTIVDRCRWLAEPLRPEFRLLPTTAQAEGAAGAAVVGGWLQLFGQAAVDVASGKMQPAGSAQSAAPLSPVLAAGSAGLAECDLDAEQRLIGGVEFSPDLNGWIREYEVVGNRNVYLWRWCLHGLRLTTLPCVESALRASLCETKLLAVMLGVMLDDIADLGGNRQLLKLLNEVVAEDKTVDLSAFNSQEQAYGRFTVRLSSATWSRLRQYPGFEQFAELLMYDHRQIVNAMDYSSLLNQDLALVNLVEHDAYSPHNMQMMSFATMDLMGSRGFDRRELGRLCAVIWHAQSMGRIGNLLSTWQREVKVRDFTSGVFARALQQGDLEVDDLECSPTDAIEQAIQRGSHDAYFIERLALSPTGDRSDRAEDPQRRPATALGRTEAADCDGIRQPGIEVNRHERAGAEQTGTALHPCGDGADSFHRLSGGRTDDLLCESHPPLATGHQLFRGTGRVRRRHGRGHDAGPGPVRNARPAPVLRKLAAQEPIELPDALLPAARPSSSASAITCIRPSWCRWLRRCRFAWPCGCWKGHTPTCWCRSASALRSAFPRRCC